jgi:carbamoyl-phosphate synthase large subunit
MLAAGLDVRLPPDGRVEDTGKGRKVFISVRDEDKPVACIIARRLRAAGYEIVATRGTAAALQRARIPAAAINKVLEGSPHVVDAIRSGTIAVVVNTTTGAREVKDSYSLRRQTLLMNIPYFTTIAAALAACDALETALGDREVRVRSLQEWGAGPR